MIRLQQYSFDAEFVARLVPYDLVDPRVDKARSRRFLLDTDGVGDPCQSMYGHDEMRAYVVAEADYFQRNGVTAVVTGFALTTLLSTRLAGVPLITQHAGSYVPPLLERAGRPVPPPSHRPYLAVFDTVAAELCLPRILSLPALLLGDGSAAARQHFRSPALIKNRCSHTICFRSWRAFWASKRRR